jgi:uncharacterized membrane protein YjjP (DUF1212 family)
MTLLNGNWIVIVIIIIITIIIIPVTHYILNFFCFLVGMFVFKENANKLGVHESLHSSEV